MRRLTIFAIPALALTLGGGLALASPAYADASIPGHFSYNDGLFGPVECNEVHHPTNDLPASAPAGAVTTGGYDTITCQIANPSHAGQDFSDTWTSDFVVVGPNPLPPGTDTHLGLIQVNVNGTGSVYHGLAWYPNN
jgi:hypothetical protein